MRWSDKMYYRACTGKWRDEPRWQLWFWATGQHAGARRYMNMRGQRLEPWLPRWIREFSKRNEP